jgi:hypothetical protein
MFRSISAARHVSSSPLLFIVYMFFIAPMSCSRRAEHNGRFFRRKKRCFRVSPFWRNLISCIGGFARRAKQWRPPGFAGSTGFRGVVVPLKVGHFPDERVATRLGVAFLPRDDMWVEHQAG